MMENQRRYETRFGAVLLRPERPDDDPFLLHLFRGHSIDVLHAARIPEPMIDDLIKFQFRSQTTTYRGMFPNAVYSIIESDGVPIGRLIEEKENDTVYFVDFALLPERQAKGLGTAFIEMVADEWATKGFAARVKVLMNNEPSLKLCKKLGFVQNEEFEMGYIGLRREPPK